MKTALLLTSIVFLALGNAPCPALDAGDLLILQDIGPYRLSKPEKLVPGLRHVGGPRMRDNAGVLAETGHLPDHADTTAEVTYHGGKAQASPTVTVTRHAGGESDKWLPHEIDASFRRYGQPGNSYILKNVEGNTIITRFIGGAEYQWLSGSTVVHIEYHDSMLAKAEPLDIIKAYLAKYPSTLKLVTDRDLMGNESKTTWIRDEMERKLWLCDKWLQTISAGNTRLEFGLRNVGDNLKGFGGYRDRYFGKRPTADDSQIDEYVAELTGTEIKAKLREYRKWWSENSTKGLSFGPQVAPREETGE